MNVELSLVIGLLVGLVYVACRRIRATADLRLTSGAMLVKWRHGIGRASVIEVNGTQIRLTSPVMRENYAPPSPGGELLLKPLTGGRVARGRFVANGDAGWTIRLSK